MSHIVSELKWGTIDIIVTEVRVFFQQRWKYDWQVKVPLRNWTLKEKRAFHAVVDRQIWASWSNKVTLSVSGKSDFARKFSGNRIPMNLDVRWVTTNPHWNVIVLKIPDNEIPQDLVWWDDRKIKLHTSKLKPYTACNLATPQVCKPGFKSVPHEFGHSIGHDDEYIRPSPHLPDANSIMNVGRELRKRHFGTLITAMNKMIPGTTFTVHQVG